MNRIEQLENLINVTFEKREKELSELEKAIEADNASMTTARAKLENATTENNLDAYRQAKADLAFTHDRAELHKARLNQLKNKPLISDLEYTKQVNEVLADVKEMQDKATKKAIALIDQLEALTDESASYTMRANRALEQLYKDVYRLADQTEREKKINVITTSRTPQSALPAFNGLVNTMRRHANYEVVKGHRYIESGRKF